MLYFKENLELGDTIKTLGSYGRTLMSETFPPESSYLQIDVFSMSG